MRALAIVAAALVSLLAAAGPARAEMGVGAAAAGAPDDVQTRPGAPATFDRWLAELLEEARQRGFSDALLERTLAGVQPLPAVLERDRNQPETTVTFEQYVERRVTPEVIRRGRALLRDHAPLLVRVRDAYDVPPPYVLAVWGLESDFGRHAGRTPIFQALATLAWEPRRASFFRLQLYDALTMVDQGLIDAASMLGSWAGAMGQPQFLPSSYLAYAVDFDGDGRRDIWTSHADTFASIANYLKHHGWRGDQTWGRPVRVTAAVSGRIAEEVPSRASGCRAMRETRGPAPLARWQRLGVRRADGGDLPAVHRDATLVRAGARHFLVYDNYDALLRYNCSHHYALTVAMLAERIRGGAPATASASVRPQAR